MPSERLFSEFDAVASSYDRLAAAGPGYHRDLTRSARSLQLPGSGQGLRLLDVGCGTGASTAALLRAAPRAEIVAIDGSAGMLAQARAKQWPESVRFVHTSLELLDDTGIHGRFDAVFAAYLVRNLPDPDAGLRALLAQLKPGAPIAVQEYALPASGPARLYWTAVCWAVIIPAGAVLSGRGELYRYLWRSVRDFDTPQELEQRMRHVGFEHVQARPLPGWQRGVAHTFTGRRSASSEGAG